MLRKFFYLLLVGYLLFTAVWVLNAGREQKGGTISLLNVACDPTRELWRDLNQEFIADYEAKTGQRIQIRQSHGGSSSQARAVIDGLPADVVTLALWNDTDAIRKAGRIHPGWEHRLDNRSLPFTSTIVFVVRQGNPKNIRDWADLARTDVEVITPNPKTSGNGKWSFLALWGSVTTNGGSDEQAREFVRGVYSRVPVLDTSARGATMTFAHRAKKGDVHLTWENEAHLEVQETGGALEIVYPKRSVLAEPHVAVVDSVVDKKGTRAAAEAYMQFLYTDIAQEIIARHHLRPSKKEIAEKHAGQFPALELYPVTQLAQDWDAMQNRFFAEGAEFDQIIAPQGKP